MLRHMPNALLWIWYWVNPITGILKNLQMMAFAWSIVYMNDQYDDDNGGGDNYPGGRCGLLSRSGILSSHLITARSWSSTQCTLHFSCALDCPPIEALWALCSVHWPEPGPDSVRTWWRWPLTWATLGQPTLLPGLLICESYLTGMKMPSWVMIHDTLTLATVDIYGRRHAS